MIASRDGEAVAVHRARNAANSALKYVMDPQEQYQLQTAIEDADLDLGAIYHSHTRSDPVPSQTLPARLPKRPPVTEAASVFFSDAAPAP